MQHKITDLALSQHSTNLFPAYFVYHGNAKQICKFYKFSVLVTPLRNVCKI